MNQLNFNLYPIQKTSIYSYQPIQLPQILFNLENESYTLRCKNGSKIHIKKKNKGSFTSYCGGKITDECITRGKNSKNPITRKRAIFAQNARNWNK